MSTNYSTMHPLSEELKEMNILDSYIKYIEEYIDLNKGSISTGDRKIYDLIKLARGIPNYPLTESGKFSEEDTVGKDIEELVIAFMEYVSLSHTIIDSLLENYISKHKDNFLNVDNENFKDANMDLAYYNIISGTSEEQKELSSALGEIQNAPFNEFKVSLLDILTNCGIIIEDWKDPSEENNYQTTIYFSTPKYSRVSVASTELAKIFKSLLIFEYFDDSGLLLENKVNNSNGPEFIEKFENLPKISGEIKSPTNPPITDAGRYNDWNNLTLVLKNTPIKSKTESNDND